jgi:hypothetical protein
MNRNQNKNRVFRKIYKNCFYYVLRQHGTKLQIICKNNFLNIRNVFIDVGGKWGR